MQIVGRHINLTNGRTISGTRRLLARPLSRGMRILAVARMLIPDRLILGLAIGAQGGGTSNNDDVQYRWL
jgi:hypothetical protein